ncbi:MAG: phage tail tape measure C-terminal domain-containing protein [Pseudomonadota bacterium]
MDELDTSLERASERLQAFADGPAKDAAQSVERSFAEAGQRIEAILAQAARSGELDFKGMAEAILKDIARIAAEGVFAPGRSGGQAGQTINLNLLGQSAPSARGVIASQGAIASALAKTVSAGGRFL